METPTNTGRLQDPGGLLLFLAPAARARPSYGTSFVDDAKLLDLHLPNPIQCGSRPFNPATRF